LQSGVNQCLSIATTVEAVALLFELAESLGLAAAQTAAQIATFDEVLNACLVAEFAADLFTIPVTNTSQWGPWQ
jgi:hypothetical protein